MICFCRILIPSWVAKLGQFNSFVVDIVRNAGAIVGQGGPTGTKEH